VARWPLHPPPFDDELLSSWIVRLAVTYHMEPLTFCREALALEPSAPRTLDHQPPPALLTRLADVTGCPISRVVATTLQRYEGCLFVAIAAPVPAAMLAMMQGIDPDRSRAAPWTRVRTPWRGAGATPWLFLPQQAVTLQFCPQCVRDDALAYPRTAWRLALTTACPQHRVLLREACLQCGVPVDVVFLRWRHPSFRYCLCGADLGHAPTAAAPPALAALTDRIHEAVTTGTVRLDETAPLPAETFFTVLRALVEAVRLTHARQPWAEACWRTLGGEPVDIRPHVAVPFEAQPLAWRVATMQLVGDLLTAWPSHFLASCQRVALKAVPLLRRMQGLPPTLLRPLVHVLMAQDPPTLTRFLLATPGARPPSWPDLTAWAQEYLMACRRLGMADQVIRSRSRGLPAPWSTALDDALFAERVDRAVTRAVVRARAPWWRGLS
jgi:TniQ